MGVKDLLKALKEGASRQESFSRGDGLLLIDGGFMLHKSLSRSGVACALYAGDTRGLVNATCDFVKAFQDAGWTVFVVFDGIAPPAKAGTNDERRSRRQSAESRLAEATTQQAQDKLMVQCVHFDARTVEKVSRAISARCQVETMSAPFEGDSQFVYLEEQMGPRFHRCYIHGNDSDLVVLGAKNLAWRIGPLPGQGHELVGDVICRHLIHQPTGATFTDTKRGNFLRKLHGVSDDCVNPRPLPPDLIDRRLLAFGLAAGNDYHSYPGVGFDTASRLALPIECLSGAEDWPAELELLAKGVAAVVSKRAVAGGEILEATRRSLQESVYMFRHTVVFDPYSGRQRRQHDLPPGSAESERKACVSTGMDPHLATTYND